jgi:hypothetical protein
MLKLDGFAGEVVLTETIKTSDRPVLVRRRACGRFLDGPCRS